MVNGESQRKLKVKSQKPKAESRKLKAKSQKLEKIPLVGAINLLTRQHWHFFINLSTLSTFNDEFELLRV